MSFLRWRFAKSTIAITDWTWLESLILDLLTIAIPIAFIYFFVPFQETWLYNSDEGLEIIKALLLQKGHSLYEPLWSDQPPIFTWLLGAWSQFFGKTVASIRTLTILFSILLLFSFRRLIAHYFDNVTSIYAVIVLMLSQNFLQLSVSVMQAIPSLSLGVFSLYFLVLYLSSKFVIKPFLILSAIVLALGIQIKFWIIILIPVSLIYLITDTGRLFEEFKVEKVLEKLIDVVIWSISLVVPILTIAWLAQPFPLNQLLGAHFKNRIYEYLDLTRMFSLAARSDRILLLFALAGFFLACFSKKKGLSRIFIPTLWLMFNFILFWNHRPIWYHYYSIFVIPLVWLSSYFFWWSWSTLASQRVNIETWQPSKLLTLPKIKSIKYGIAAIVMALSMYSMRGKVNYYTMQNAAEWGDDTHNWQEIVSAISNYRDKTNWLYTDNPILAVHTDLPIPPEVAVITKKRFGRGGDYEQKLLSSLQSYQPEQLVFTNYQSLLEHPQIGSYIKQHYELAIATRKFRQYILKDLKITRQN